MAGVPWSDHEEKIIRNLIGAGCAPKEIRQVFPNRTYGAISNKLKAMSLFYQPLAPDIDMDAYRLLTGKGGLPDEI